MVIFYMIPRDFATKITFAANECGFIVNYEYVPIFSISKLE